MYFEKGLDIQNWEEFIKGPEDDWTGVIRVLDRRGAAGPDEAFPSAKPKCSWGPAIADLARALALPDIEIRKLIARMFSH
jgi:hypothetical protein